MGVVVGWYGGRPRAAALDLLQPQLLLLPPMPLTPHEPPPPPPPGVPCSQRHVPKGVLKAKRARFEEEQRERRKLANVRAHSAVGSGRGIPTAERVKAIVGTTK